MSQTVIGIDIGGTNTKIGAYGNHDFYQSISFPTQAQKPFEDFKSNLNHHLSHYCNTHNIDLKNTKIGVGCPNVNSKTKELLNPPNLSWGNLAIQKGLRESIHENVYFENDANLAAFGEYKFGSATNLKNFIVITMGTGIGSGIFIDGKLYVGSTGLGGEVGHMTIGSEGIICGCGGRDHFESYCSVSGLVSIARQKMNQEMNYPELVALFHKKDSLAVEIFNESAKNFAIAIANLIALFSPEKIILTGGGMNIGKSFIEMIQSHIPTYVFQKNHQIASVEMSESISSQGAVRGAIAYALSI